MQRRFSKLRQRQWVKRFLENNLDVACIQPLIDEVSEQQWCDAEKLFEESLERGARPVSIFDPVYPQLLREIDDPPLVLYVRGQLDSRNRVAIVGTRRATPAGLKTAHEFARALVESGVGIASGLARGIDTAAHEGAIAGTAMKRHPGTAVLGSGAFAIYPKENRQLAEKLLDSGGCILSEYGLDTQPLKHHFPERNRIISGLCGGVIVIEAEIRSGALITARLALEQGRDLFSVPGSIYSPASDGTNRLIRDGAAVICNLDDLALAFYEGVSFSTGIATRPESQVKLNSTDLSADTRLLMSSICTVLGDRLQHPFEDFLTRGPVNPFTVMAALSELEVIGAVRCLPGRLFSWHEDVDMPEDFEHFHSPVEPATEGR